MSKKTKGKSKDPELVQIDIYYLPAELAEMYRVLRETVAEETMAWMATDFTEVERIADPQGGEYIRGINPLGREVKYYLSPHNISAAQKARDKEQLATYLEKEFNQ